jgi:hypothetical protein
LNIFLPYRFSRLRETILALWESSTFRPKDEECGRPS